MAEFARVTRGHFVMTVRAIGSTPTIYVDALERRAPFGRITRMTASPSNSPMAVAWR